jgi:hypothetical protein
MIAGDLNARIAQEEDFIPLDSDKHIPLFYTYKFDARIVGITNSFCKCRIFRRVVYKTYK